MAKKTEPKIEELPPLTPLQKLEARRDQLINQARQMEANLHEHRGAIAVLSETISLLKQAKSLDGA